MCKPNLVKRFCPRLCLCTCVLCLVPGPSLSIISRDIPVRLDCVSADGGAGGVRHSLATGRGDGGRVQGGLVLTEAGHAGDRGGQGQEEGGDGQCGGEGEGVLQGVGEYKIKVTANYN